MSQTEKMLYNIMCGYKDNDIAFNDLRKILAYYGFECRIKGDHYIYTKQDIAEIINLQPLGNKAKAYQVKQIRNLFVKYQLGGK